MIWDPFWAHLDTFGPSQTKINVLPHKDKVGFGRGAFGQNHFLFEMVPKGPDGPKRVLNGQKHLGLSFWNLLEPFGSLLNVEKPDTFDHFCLFYWCVFWDTLYYNYNRSINMTGVKYEVQLCRI